MVVSHMKTPQITEPSPDSPSSLRIKIEKSADSLLGTPFVVFGRDRKGIDCLGVVIYIYRECLGIKIPDFLTEKPEEVMDHPLMKLFRKAEIPEDGDVVEFLNGSGASHVGIFCDRKIIHAAEKTGVIITPRSRFFLPVVGYFRYDPR